MQEAFGLKGVKQLLKNTSTDKEHVFQTLLHEADQIFVGMDDLFMKKDVDNMPYTGHVRTANLEIIDGVYYEMLQKRLLPFDMQATEKAVWECLRRLALDNLRGVGGSNALVNVHPNCTKEDGDTLQSHFFAVISGIEDLTGTYNLKVARRYKGSDRTTFVCRIISEPKFESRKQGVNNVEQGKYGR
ncbi:Hypothetical protein PHPALM_5430 [Phytophthora palmivora]|uniref:Uncharacterized protein n=1 Tax=Phytophthora palmivora TaxID=4796 RepID=A0A2P4YHE1_9STRA|nr:Hypothetical protein PHPALM_5430 [Phytophthora palmivora]